MVKQRFGCIYRLTNLVTKKTYIGKSVNFKQRMRQHKYPKKTDKTYLHNSIRKHGWDKFKKEIIIDDVPEEDLSNLEISYIEVENTMCPNGYNLTKGGQGTSGYKYTPEQREIKIKVIEIYNSKLDEREKRKKFLKEHDLLLNDGTKPFDCKTISIDQFSLQNGLKAHVSKTYKTPQVSNTKKVDHICPTCSNKYSTKRILNRHMKEHTSSAQFSCPDKNCEKKFSRTDQLKEHSVTHTGEKPFSCSMCPRKFSGSKARHRHMKNKSCGKYTWNISNFRLPI